MSADRPRHISSRRQPWIKRPWIILGLLGFMIVMVVGGYQLYRIQREQNTRRLLQTAQEAAAAEDWPAALVSYRLYLQRQPSDDEALRQYGDALLAQMAESPELIGEAVRVLRQRIAVAPNDTDALGKLTQLFLGLREHVQAEPLARRWLALQPDNAEAVLTLSHVLQQMDRPTQAADVLREAILARQSAGTPDPQLYPPFIALLVEALDRPAEARAWLDQALASYPDAFEVQMAAFALAQSPAGGGSDEEAEAHLKRALQLAPQEGLVLASAGTFYTGRGDLDRAEAYLDRAAEVAGTDPLYLNARTHWAIRRNTPQAILRAAEELLAAQTLVENERLARAAELFLRAGALDKANECIERLAVSPRRDEQRDVSTASLRGAYALFANEPYAAIPHLENALRRRPMDLWTTELLAIAYGRTGALQEAGDLYRRICVLRPDAVQARLALARLAWQQRDCAESLAQLQHLADRRDNLTSDQAYRAAVLQSTCEIEAHASSGQPLPKALSDRLETLAEATPFDAGSAEMLTRSFILADRVDRVAELVNIGIDRIKEDIIPFAVEASLALLNGDHPRPAAEIAAQLKKHFPDMPSGHELRVRILAATEGAEAAGKYIRESPLDAAARGPLWEALADFYLRDNQIESALPALRLAVEQSPGALSARRKLARFTPDLAEAQAMTDAMRDIEGPDGVHWRYERASSLLRLNPDMAAAQEAINLLRTSLASRPGWVNARLMLGLAYETTGALDQAAESYGTAFSQRPVLAGDQLAIRYVDVLKRLGRFMESDRVLDTLVRELPEQPDVLRLETERLLRMQRLSAALSAAERRLQLTGHDPAWAALTAGLHLRAGNPERAEEVGRAALEKDPTSASLLWIVCSALLAQERGDEAEELARETAGKQSGGMHHVLLAQLLMQRNKPAAAEEAMEEALRRAPEDAAVCGAATDFWGQRGDRARQLTLARRTVSLRDEDPTLSLQLATLLLRGGTSAEREEAEAMVERRLRQNPEDVPTLLLEAEIALDRTPPDLTRAETSLRRALSRDPRSVKAHTLLAAVQVRSARLNTARQTVAAGLLVAPDEPELLLMAAQIHSYRGEYRLAIPSLKRILQLRPRHPQALELLVIALRQTRQTDQAVEILEPFIPSERRSPMELVLLAGLYESRNQLDQAMALFQQAMDNDDESATGFRAYLQHLARRGEFERIRDITTARRESHPGDAMSFLTAAELLAIQPADPELRRTGLSWMERIIETVSSLAPEAAFRTGMCYYQFGDLNNAETMFLRARRLAPMAPRPVNALAWLYSEELGRPADALSLIDQFLADGGQPNPELLDTHAAVLIRKGRFPEARERLASCLELAGQTSTLTAANFRMGLVLLESGRREEALMYVRQALELDTRLGGLTESEQKQARQLAAY